MASPFFEFTEHSIERLKLRFSDYERSYPKFLQEYIDQTDGTESQFLMDECDVFEDILYLWREGFHEDSGKDVHVLRLNQIYASYQKQIGTLIVNVTYNNRFENSTTRKIELLNRKKSKIVTSSHEEASIFADGVQLESNSDSQQTISLNMKMLCIYYLDKHKHICLNKIHPDKKHLAKILSFLIDNSSNTINQKLGKFTPDKIIEIKEIKGVLEKVLRIFEPFSDMFPGIIDEINKDLKRLKN